MLEKSKEALLLAVEVFNKPTVLYRVEAFSIFFINSWELLLKAYLIEKEKNVKVIFEPDNPNNTISLSTCVGRAFSNSNDPIRKNIEDIADIRKYATHLVIPELETLYAGLFQRGVINYLTYLDKWFESRLDITPRLMSLVFDFNPGEYSKITIDSHYGKEVGTFFEALQKTILKNIESLGEEYSIAIHSKLALVNKPSHADIILGSGHKGGKEGIPIIIAKDSTKTHPYLGNRDRTEDNVLYKSVVKIVQDKTGASFTVHDISCIKDKERISELTRPDFIFKSRISKSSLVQYSMAFIDYIVNKVRKDTSYLKKCREHKKNKNAISRFERNILA